MKIARLRDPNTMFGCFSTSLFIENISMIRLFWGISIKSYKNDLALECENFE